MVKNNSGKSLMFVLTIVFVSGICLSSELFAKSKKETAFIGTTNYEVGSLSSMSTAKKRTVSKDLLTIHQDAVVKGYGKKIYIVQRQGADSVIVISAKNPGEPLTEYSIADIAESSKPNPQDMVLKNRKKAYISLYGENNLLVINPQNGKLKKKIDLSSFADGDGNVEMGEMVIVKNYLYVSLQRLENYSAENKSMVVVIDTKKDKIVDLDPATNGNQAIELTGRNPYKMVYNKETGKIYISLSGNFTTDDAFGGIEVVNPETNESEGILIKDEDLGGFTGAIAIKSADAGYITVSKGAPDYIYDVVLFNPSTGEKIKKLNKTGSGYIPTLVIDGRGYLYVCDQTAENPGVRIFSTKNNKLVKGPVDVGLLPFSITFVKSK